MVENTREWQYLSLSCFCHSSLVVMPRITSHFTTHDHRVGTALLTKSTATRPPHYAPPYQKKGTNLFLPGGYATPNRSSECRRYHRKFLSAETERLTTTQRRRIQCSWRWHVERNDSIIIITVFVVAVVSPPPPPPIVSIHIPSGDRRPDPAQPR